MHVVLLSAQSICDENASRQSKTLVLGHNQLCYHFLGVSCMTLTLIYIYIYILRRKMNVKRFLIIILFKDKLKNA